MSLGLGTQIGRGGVRTPSHVTSNLKMLHRYNAGSVVPVSDGAAYFVQDENDRVSIADHNDLDLGSTNDFSFCCWFNSSDVTDEGFLGKISTTSGDDRWYWRLEDSSKLSFFSESTSSGGARTGLNFTGDFVFSAYTWYHVAMTCDRSDTSAGIKFYVNGAFDKEGSDGNQSDNLDNDGALVIGGRTATAGDFGTGYLCNMGFWSGVLTQAQIKSIMWKNYAGLTTGTGSESENLVSWYNLDEGTGTTATDSHGSNNGSATFS